jgi:rod shape-determining protein MreC
VITSTGARLSPQQQQDIATSEALKGPEAAAILEKKKASEIMAERLPGLTDPNAPVPNPAQSGQPQTTPTTPPKPKLLPSVHPDRFSPGTTPQDAPNQAAPAKSPSESPGKPAPKTAPQRNP